MSSDSSGFASYWKLLSEPSVIAMGLVAFVAIVGFEAVSPALPTVADSLGIADARIGLVMTAFSAPMAVFVPVTGILADVYGRRPVIIPSLIGFGAAGVSIAAADTFEAILALRVVQGLAFAGMLSVSVVILGDLYTGPQGSTVMGIRKSASGIGSFLVPAIAGWLATIAWQYPFLLHALAFPVAALVYVSVPETMPENTTNAALTATIRDYGRQLRTELVDRDLSLLVAGGFIHGASRIAVITFVPLFLVRVLGSTLATAGIILSIRGVALTVVPPLSGPLTDRFSRNQGLAGSLGIMAAGIALLAVAPAVSWVGAMVLLFIVGSALFSPILKEGVTTVASDDHRAGVVTGMYVLQFGGEAITPAALGLVLAVLGFQALFLTTSVVVAGYAVLVTLLLVRE